MFYSIVHRPITVTVVVFLRHQVLDEGLLHVRQRLRLEEVGLGHTQDVHRLRLRVERQLLALHFRFGRHFCRYYFQVFSAGVRSFVRSSASKDNKIALKEEENVLVTSQIFLASGRNVAKLVLP